MGEKDQADQSSTEVHEEMLTEADQHESEADADDFEETGAGTVDEEVGRLREALLRTRAEMDNMQKRSQRELEKARKFQLEAFMRDLLPVIDALDQGLDGADESENAHEGMVLTRKLLLKALEQHGLETIDPIGQSFDPQWHEAMSMQPTEEAAPDTVLIVLQKGYRLHDRLLRAARVIVARSPLTDIDD